MSAAVVGPRCERPEGCDLPARVRVDAQGFDAMRLCLNCASQELDALADLAATGSSCHVELSAVAA